MHSFIFIFIVVSVPSQDHGVLQTWNTYDFSEHGKLRESLENSVQHHAKIVTNKIVFVRHSNICVKQLFDWVNSIITMSGSRD